MWPMIFYEDSTRSRFKKHDCAQLYPRDIRRKYFCCSYRQPWCTINSLTTEDWRTEESPGPANQDRKDYYIRAFSLFSREKEKYLGFGTNTNHTQAMSRAWLREVSCVSLFLQKVTRQSWLRWLALGWVGLSFTLPVQNEREVSQLLSFHWAFPDMIGRTVRSADPTEPITLSSSGAPRGVWAHVDLTPAPKSWTSISCICSLPWVHMIEMEWDTMHTLCTWRCTVRAALSEWWCANWSLRRT